MPISPDDGARLAAAAGQIAHEAELRILERVQSYYSAGLTAPDWALKKYEQVAELRTYLERQAASLERSVARAVSDGIAEAYWLGVDAASADLAAAGRPALAFPPASIAALNLLAQDVMNRTSGAIAQIVRTVPDAYQAAVASAVGDVLLGTATRRVAAQRAINRLLGEGIGGFTDSAGRNWYLPSYVEMATRTATGRAAIQGHVDTLKANGEGLIHVIPGPRPCPICDEWAGRVLAITRADLEPPAQNTLDEARAQGWGHPNCRCSTALYIEGYSTLSTERLGSDTYEDAQRQRAIERNIRYWKRRSALALDDATRAAADRKVRQWQQALREHLAAHPELKRLRYRESITATGMRGKLDIPAPRSARPQLNLVPPGAHAKPYDLNRIDLDVLAKSRYRIGDEWDPDSIRAGHRLLADQVRPILQKAATAGVRIQVNGNLVETIVRQGRIKSIHEVTGAKGADYIRVRKRYEKEVMGIPTGTKKAKYPVYGWAPAEPIETGRASIYGDVEFRLKPEVLGRTTWTVGDSLNKGARPLWTDEISKATDIELAGTTGPSAMVRAVSEADLARQQPAYKANYDLADWSEYVEAQVHGGVSLADIAEIRIDRDTYQSLAQDVKDALARAGIKIHH